MRANIERVLRAFAEGKSCREQTCSTDGKTLYSYDMPIASWVKLDGGGPIVVERSEAPSNTTRSQIDAVHVYFTGWSNSGAALGIKSLRLVTGSDLDRLMTLPPRSGVRLVLRGPKSESNAKKVVFSYVERG